MVTLARRFTMYVCVCAAVTDAQVRACVDAGACTVEEIGERCAAGTGCGSCLDRLHLMLEKHPIRGHAA